MDDRRGYINRRAVLHAVGCLGVATVGIASNGRAQQETEPATPTDEPFEPSLRISCYDVGVDAESYDEVELTFVSSETVLFDDGYAGENTFGYAGYEPLADVPDDRTFETFDGAIEQLTVRQGGETRTVSRTQPCGVQQLEFSCSSVTRDGDGDTIAMFFTDGSEKLWDPPVNTGQQVFGSPGRPVDQVQFSDENLTVEAPDPDCVPTEEPAVLFDGDQVTINAEEFAGTAEFDSATIRFTDGAEQEFSDASGYSAPQTFGADETNAGKAIERFDIVQGGGAVSMNFVNPDPQPPETPTETETETETETDTPTETEPPAETETEAPTATDEPTETETESPTQTETDAETPTPTPTETATVTEDVGAAPGGGGSDRSWLGLLAAALAATAGAAGALWWGLRGDEEDPNSDPDIDPNSDSDVNSGSGPGDGSDGQPPTAGAAIDSTHREQIKSGEIDPLADSVPSKSTDEDPLGRSR